MKNRTKRICLKDTKSRRIIKIKSHWQIFFVNLGALVTLWHLNLSV